MQSRQAAANRCRIIAIPQPAAFLLYFYVALRDLTLQVVYPIEPYPIA